MALENAALLLCVITCIVSSKEIWYGSRQTGSLRSYEQVASSEDRCTFRAFLNDGRRTIVASSKNIIFESDGVLVVQERYARIMVFLTKGTVLNLWKPTCGQQAVVECGFKSAEMVSSNKEAPKVACGSYNMCLPQSEPDLSYMRSMLGGALVERKGELRHIASIGLGAGSMPLWLLKMIPSAQVEAVDISAAVIEAAPCFGLPTSSKVKLVHSDGRKHLSAQADGRYDVIFVDVFIEQEDAIPTCFKTVEFYKLVKSKLSPGGVVALNIAAPELPTIRSSLRQAFVNTSRIWVGEAPGLSNNVVLARAPGGLEEDARASGENGAGMATARIWASEAHFQTIQRNPTAKNSEPLHDSLPCSSN